MQPQLPPGWVHLVSPEGRPYYHNRATNQTTWTFPTAAPANGASPTPVAPAAPAAPAATTAPAGPAANTAPAATAAPAAQAAPMVPAVAPAGAPASAPVAGPVAKAPAPAVSIDGRFTLASLIEKTGQKDLGQGHFELEKPELLEINLGGQFPFVWIKNGSMIARRGTVKFTRQGMGEQGIKKLAMKKLTGEGVKLVKAEGQGKVFVADSGKKVCIVSLNNERLFINGNDVLALSASLKYDVKPMRGGSMAGGLFNVEVKGSGMVAFTCHGSALTLTARPGQPFYTDPNATVAWTHDPSVEVDASLKSAFGRTTGEEFQMCFHQGCAIVQPYEEIITYGTGSGGSGGGGGKGGKSGGSSLGGIGSAMEAFAG